MSKADGDRREEAIGWRIRLTGDASADDWLAFGAWLEADAGNARAYDEIVDAEAWGEARLAVAAPAGLTGAANDDQPVPGSRRRWAALASGLVAALVIAGVIIERPTRPPMVVATAAGEHRTMRLPDGTQVALNGGTLIKVDGRDQRHLTLVRGEALFTVRHNAAQPFEVASGGLVIRDLGTTFDVATDLRQTRVAVAAGQVEVASGADVLAGRLRAGQQLVSRGNLVTTSAVSASDVGGWRQGRITFTNAPLDQVAEEVSRTTGVPVRVDSSLASKRFTGLLIVDHDRDAMFRRLGPLLGIRMARESGGWHWMASAPH